MRSRAIDAMLALAMAASAPAALGADAVAPETRRLAEHLERLEKRIAELEEHNKRLEKALANENISEREPELASRLKAVEYNTLDIRKQAQVIDSIEGFAASASLTAVGQRRAGEDVNGTRLNYRADIAVTTPTIKTGDVDSKLFAHFRVGQGRGVAQDFTTFVGPNATSFQLGTAIPPENSALLLAEAYYRAEVPLPLGGFKPQSREKVTISFGKMDPFASFDQNAAANDETRQFLASPFVHNALLDNPMAANVGADGFGFSPGARIAYRNERTKSEPWGLSIGMFGAGRSADFSEGFRAPFWIAQAEAARRFFGAIGNYRLFAWRNGQAPGFQRDPADPARAALFAHRGVGANFDQRVGDYATAFGRIGWARGQGLLFDRTLSLGAEIGGSYWSRGADAIGVAVGTNRTSRGFRAGSAGVIDASGRPVFAFAATGAETVAEIYYRYRVHQNFEISPDFQWIHNPAGNGSVRPIRLIGVRVQLSQ